LRKLREDKGSEMAINLDAPRNDSFVSFEQTQAITGGSSAWQSA